MAYSIDLSGKTALVTGARRGLGKAMAVGLAEAGADVIGVSASQEEAGSDVQELVEKAGRRFIGHGCDLSDRDSVHELLVRLAKEQRQVDILVNNAGTIRRHPAVDHSDQDWDHVIEVNLNVPFILARGLGERMVERRSGKIIFTASLLSFQGGITVSRLHRLEERHRRTHSSAGQRVGRPRCECQRDRPRLHGHRQHGSSP